MAELVVESIEASPPILHRSLYSNIVLVGGNANFRNYKQRMYVMEMEMEMEMEMGMRMRMEMGMETQIG